MEKIERLILKIILVQFVFLIAAQYLVTFSDFAPYLKEVVYYEGVVNGVHQQVVETLEIGN